MAQATPSATGVGQAECERRARRRGGVRPLLRRVDPGAAANGDGGAGHAAEKRGGEAGPCVPTRRPGKLVRRGSPGQATPRPRGCRPTHEAPLGKRSSAGGGGRGFILAGCCRWVRSVCGSGRRCGRLLPRPGEGRARQIRPPLQVWPARGAPELADAARAEGMSLPRGVDPRLTRCDDAALGRSR